MSENQFRDGIKQLHEVNRCNDAYVEFGDMTNYSLYAIPYGYLLYNILNYLILIIMH